MKVWEAAARRVLGANMEPGRSDPALTMQDFADLFGPAGPFMPTTWGTTGDEELVQTLSQAYTDNGPVFALVLARMQIFAQARFQWTRFSSGTPQDLFGSADLRVLERPWTNGTTGDLLARMEMYDSSAGNAFVRRIRRGARGSATYEDRLTCLRPQWTTIIMGSQEDAEHPRDAADVELLGYAYKPGGDASRMIILLPEEVAHYAPIPDPDNNFRGMSWISPVLGSVLSDDASEIHKRKFFQNAATPNLAIKFDPTVGIEQVKKFKELMEDEHRGAFNAYKTLYLGGGADPVTVGKDFQQLAFAATQGKGESRLASAAGVPPSWVGFSEGLQGSALNAGNFGAARRRFGDGTMHHLWSNAASSLQTILSVPNSHRDEAPAQLWYDVRSIPFLREDSKDHAETQAQEAQTIKTLIEAGFEPASVVDAVRESDYTRLKHTGLVSVQLQKPGEQQPGTSPTPPEGTAP